MTSATEGAHSIYCFIERTAERVPEGVRWQTINYSNEPQYHYGAFNGCGGIGIFLAEYGRQAGSATALDLAREANRWCSTVDLEGYERGLLLGRTGAAMSWLCLAKVSGEAVSEHCVHNADVILGEEPGPVTDLMGGAASNGLYLLRLWEVTKESRYLDGARRNGAWLCEQLIHDDAGCHCLCMPGGQFGDRAFLGVAHGISGVAHYLLLLHAATGDAQWADNARDLLRTLERHAVPDHGGLNWPVLLGDTELGRCQWSHGAPGIGIVFLRAAQILGAPAYRDTALRAGQATYAYGDFRHNITQCIGLSGCGELFVELYRDSGDAIWLQRAHEFADMAMVYRAALPEGDAWPTDEPGLYSADYMYGAAGLGHYFLRLQRPQDVYMPYM
jgi:lantibiotic modifying enzyme